MAKPDFDASKFPRLKDAMKAAKHLDDRDDDDEWRREVERLWREAHAA